MGPKRLYGTAGGLAVGVLGLFVPVLVLAGLVVAVLAVVMASGRLAAARRGGPTPLEHLEASAGNRAASPPGTGGPG